MRCVLIGAGLAVSLTAVASANNFTNNIMITGYWPPTNNMVRDFSPNPDQNNGQWLGGNWEGRGYNIFSYFPEFPGQTGPSWGKGVGDFEVDYQKTSADWQRITDQVKPVAIITFSRAQNNFEWRLEGGNRMYAESQWTPDFQAPTRPGSDLPIMQALAPGTELFSTLPINDIIDNVSAQVPGLNARTVPIDNGRYLSNYIGLHGNWYHELNKDPGAEFRNFAAGHIHVGYAMSQQQALDATLVTLRTLTDHLDILGVPAPSSAAAIALGGLMLARRRRSA